MPVHKKTVVGFCLGDRVVLTHSAGMRGKVVELRGPLGPGGAPVYRVLLGRKPRRRYVEVLEEQLEAARPRTAPSPEKSAS